MIITALLVLAVAAVVGFGVALALRSKREFTEQNEVVPGHRSPAPASWAGAHSREARLHRRLGAAVRGAHANPRLVELGLAPQLRSIDAEAMAIDERLVAVAALPAAHRDAAIDTMEEHVAALETTIAEMVTSVSVADSKAQLEQAVSAADLRLHTLALARAEVERIDRRAAGHDAESPPTQRSTPPDRQRAEPSPHRTRPATPPEPPSADVEGTASNDTDT